MEALLALLIYILSLISGINNSNQAIDNTNSANRIIITDDGVGKP